MICLLQLRDISQVIPITPTEKTYYLLGKNLPFSGIRGLSSSSALILHVIAVMPNMMKLKIAVFDFQFLG